MEQRLSDVKGITEIKDEINDVIKMIKNTSDYTDKGAKLYKGVLLAGAPGTGKTLLAPIPTYISSKLDPVQYRKLTFDSPAIALAKRVFPVPGAPASKTPLYSLAPLSV